jgi:hypothetical protein
MKKLHAFFESMCEARAAASALSEAGCGRAVIDLAGKLDYEFAQTISAMEDGRSAKAQSDHLSALLMELWTRGLNDRKPVSSNPWIVAQSQDHCEEGELKISTKLMLKVPEEAFEKAAGIIHENGGRIFPSAMV